MGSLLYDFLTESFLFADASVSTEYAAWSDEDLQKELGRYREFALSSLDALQQEIRSGERNLQVFHPDEHASIEVLKQTALYVEQYVICDPLFPLTHEQAGPSATIGHYLGFNAPRLKRNRLVQVIRFLKAIAPMIAADFVKLLPTTYFSEPPNDIPIYYSENNYEDGIPTPILRFLRERASVSSLERLGDRWVARGDFYPARGITVTFPGYDRGFIYYLFKMEILKTKDEGATVRAEFMQSLPKTPPSQPEFDIWVSQSKNRAAKSIVEETLRGGAFAAINGSLLLTQSKLKAELLNRDLSASESVQSSTVDALFQLDLPFLGNIDVGRLMEVRMNDGEAFQSFRTELERQLRELRLVKDPEHLRLKQQNVVHELFESQVRQVDQKLRSLKKKACIDATLLLGGLATGIQTGGWSLVASAFATAKGYQTIQDYFLTVRQNPAFFLWKLSQAGAGAKRSN